MSKNKGKSENLLNSMARLQYLLQEGFSRTELAEILNIQYGTLGKIIRGFSKDITILNHEKIKKFYSDYIIQKSNKKYIFDDEEVIDSKDAEEGAKEVAKWLYISMTFVLISTFILIAIIKYIVSLF